MNNKPFLTGFNLAQECDLIYSGIFTPEQVRKIDTNEYRILKELANKQIVIKRNTIFFFNNIKIFTCLDFVEELFYLIKKYKINEQIILYTHQSDRSVDKSLFLKKPSNVILWYSTNINYSHNSLKAIPIGIADNDKKNLSINEISSYLKTKKISDDLADNKLLYVNFRENTNLKHRIGLYEYFQQFNWALVDDSNLSNEEYLNKIAIFPFVFCPWGNGFDSHRIWESLSAGSIPITRAHITFEQYKDVPMVLVDDYKDITQDYLFSLQDSFLSKKFNNSELFVDHWIDSKITRVSNKDTKVLNSNLSFVKLKEVYYSLSLLARSKKKIMMYYILKIKEIMFNKKEK